MLIRYSPSGPPITNVEGGTAEVGAGFRLRLDEGTTDVTYTGALSAGLDYEVKQDPIADTTPPFLRPRLENPSNVRRYRVTGGVGVFSSSPDATATITSKIWVSYDEAVSWALVTTCQTKLVYTQMRYARIDYPLTLGGDAPLSMPVGATSIMVRMTIAADLTVCKFSAPGGDGGTGFLQLSEHL